MKCLFVGGCKDGQIIDVDISNLNRAQYALAEDMATMRTGDQSRPVAMHTYEPKKFGCEDGWIETVFIDDRINIYRLTEDEIIGFIMTGWRARKGLPQ
jgi:hypothetical protein